MGGQQGVIYTMRQDATIRGLGRDCSPGGRPAEGVTSARSSDSAFFFSLFHDVFWPEHAPRGADQDTAP